MYVIAARPRTAMTNPPRPNATHMNTSNRMIAQNESGMIVTK
jgi:hypothetical protein